MRSAFVRAQAKLNLWLHVTGREPSGYHTIETLFHRIDVADDVTVTLAPSGEHSVRSSENVGPERENLAFRAAAEYCRTRGWATGFRIEIVKRLPVGGGLGGGSADAAATVLALDALASRSLGRRRLLALGASLGADVPFFLSRMPAALAWGRGDRMLQLPPLPQRQVALVFPGFSISTAEAYARFQLPPVAVPNARKAVPGVISYKRVTSWAAIAKHAHNDLATSALMQEYRILQHAMRVLRGAGAVMAEMTGSGSTVFGIFEAPPDVAALASEIGCRVELTQTAVAVEAVQLCD